MASRKAGTNCWGLLPPRKVARVGRDSAAKAHLLVCAPSNSALDEIVLRILKTGLMDKDGNMCVCLRVRVCAWLCVAMCGCVWLWLWLWLC